MPIISSPSPYLNVTRSARSPSQRGMRSTSSCSTFTHSTGPMPSGKSNTSGSENGGVVRQPLSRSQTTGGLRHSSMTVQIENDGAKISFPSSSRTTRFAPSRTPSSSTDENSRSTAYRANTSERPGSTPMPTSASRSADLHSAAEANCSSPSLMPVSAYGADGCGTERLIAMSR